MSGEVDNSEEVKPVRRYRAERTKAWPKNTLFGSNLEIVDRSATASIAGSEQTLRLPAELQKREKPQPSIPAEWERKYLQPLQAELEERKAAYAKIERKFANNASAVTVLGELAQAAAGDEALMNHLWSLTGGPEPGGKSHTSATSRMPSFRNAGCQINEAELLNMYMPRRKAGDESEENELNFFRKAADSANLIQRDMDLIVPRTNHANDYQVWWPTNLQPERLYKNKLKPRKVVPVNPDDLPKNITQSLNDPQMREWVNSEDFRKSLNEYEKSRRKPNARARMLERVRTEPMALPLLSERDQMSVIFRSNLFPASLYKQPECGLMNETHNSAVHKHRDTTIPNQFRHQRDRTTKWTEENLIAERLRKGWEEYFASIKAKTNADAS